MKPLMSRPKKAAPYRTIFHIADLPYASVLCLAIEYAENSCAGGINDGAADNEPNQKL